MRLWNYAFIFCALPIFLVLVFCLWILNPFCNRGPLFFCQTRVGHAERHFQIYKFRSMCGGAERPRYGPQETHRITLLGNVLRWTHLDEIPQALNIAKGEMTLFGPRPEQPEIYAELCNQLPCYRTRSLQKPGIFSTGQIQQGYIATTRGQMRRMWFDRHDAVLMGHQDLWHLSIKSILYLIGR